MVIGWPYGMRKDLKSDLKQKLLELPMFHHVYQKAFMCSNDYESQNSCLVFVKGSCEGLTAFKSSVT